MAANIQTTQKILVLMAYCLVLAIQLFSVSLCLCGKNLNHRGTETQRRVNIQS